jgi:hypothetical protein
MEDSTGNKILIRDMMDIKKKTKKKKKTGLLLHLCKEYMKFSVVIFFLIKEWTTTFFPLFLLEVKVQINDFLRNPTLCGRYKFV